ncbi:MAG TPA: hypothetical protein VMR25_07265 [Planctomycetaceae bacterium]|jgi:hypothetical protein|nr:hypothetical protein [Planctomycetaceae bacterium]
MSYAHLPSLLRRAGWLTLAVEVVRTVCGALCLLLAAVLAALAVDAVLGLYPSALIAVDVLILVLFLGLAAYIARQSWRNRFNPRRVARQIELRLGLLDSRFINSVDFLDAPNSSCSPQLVRQSVQKGEELAAQISSIEAVDLWRPWRAMAAAFGAICVLVVAYLAAPRVFAMVVPRYLDPTGDHPPFSLLSFEIAVSPQSVYQGKPATISATLDGPDQPDRANLVFVDGKERQRLPMFRNEEGVFVLPIERAEKSREFFIETPKGRSTRHLFTVLAVPSFGKAEVRYQFPKYTGWPSTSHELDGREIRALEGTEILVSATATMPLRSARLEIFNPDGKAPGAIGDAKKTVTLEPDGNDVSTVAGRFTLAANGHYRLTLLGVNGAESHEQREGTLICVPDQLPQVAIVDPEPLVAAVEGWKVPVTVQAVDDVGIDRIVLFAGVNGWGPDPTPLKLEATQPTAVQGHYTFDLAKLGARAGDIITYYASAYDNHPSGTHFADTSTSVIHVISQAEFAEFARQKYQMDQLAQEFDAFLRRLENLQSQREKVLEELAQLQKKLDSGQPLNSEELRKMTQLETRLKEFAAQAQQLAKDLHDRAAQAQLYDVEQPYRDSLERLGKQLQQQAAHADQLREQAARLRKEPANPQLAGAFREAAQKLQKEQAPFDEPTRQQLVKTAQDVEKMRLANELISQGERLRAAVLQQRELADRMAQFRDRKKLTEDDLQRIQRLAKDQELLREEVEETKAELEKTAHAAQKTLPKMSSGALKVSKAIDDMQVGNDQARAARSARGGQGDEASGAAESAAKKLESLLANACTPKGAAESGDLDGCFQLSKPGLQQSLQQMAQGRQIPGMGKQGNQGGGFAGSQSRMAVFGPHRLSEGESDAVRASGSAPHGPGVGGSDQERDASRGAETLNPKTRQTSRSAAGNLHGVPLGYRDQAEAYFKRIAKEQ